MSEAYVVMGEVGGQDPCPYSVCVYPDKARAEKHAAAANAKAKEIGIHIESRRPNPSLEDARKGMGDLDTFVSIWSKVVYSVEAVPESPVY